MSEAPLRRSASDLPQPKWGRFDDPNSELSNLTQRLTETMKSQLQDALKQKEEAEASLRHFVEQEVKFLHDRSVAIKDQVNEMLQRMEQVQSEVMTKEKARNQQPPEPHRGKNKVFKSQDSLLSQLLRMNEFQTIYHVFVSVLVVFGMSVLIDEVIEKNVVLELSMLRWAFGKPESVIVIWVCMFLCSFIPCNLLTLWHLKWIPFSIYVALYFALQCVFFVVPPYLVREWELPIASSVIVMCEQVRMTMKMHSFVRETYKMVKNEQTLRPAARKAKEEKQASSDSAAPTSSESEMTELELKNSYLLPTPYERYSAYAFFLFCPTLIYRNEYPRTANVRWGWFVTRIVETSACIFYTYVIFKKFCVPQFERTAADPGDWKMLVASIFTSTLPGILVFLLGFFGILHCWCNGFAELCRFADRKFYWDWWNATSFSIYYRKWNIVVHDWLYAYLYLDGMAFGLKPTSALFFVFLVSAVVHEYIIWFGLGFFYPVMLVMFGGVGVFFIFLTKFQKGSRAWNVFMWTMLLLGNGMLMVFYSREWYARNSSLVGARFVYHADSRIPYSLQPFLLPSQNPVA